MSRPDPRDPRDPPVRVGDVLAGKYQVERVLGAGGMGVVVAAMHLDLRERRALKFMLPAAKGNDLAVERFLREARAAVRLRGEHVVRIFDVGRFDTGEPYMVMELLDGYDLEQALEERGALPVREAVDYTLQALEAVAEAHAAGLVHRDLKPANLFVTRGLHGESCVKVLDFGISKLTGELARGEGLDLTRTSTMLGSPYYMSPEQMRSTRDVDTRTDVWSMGVILYRLLTGTLPFEGTSITELCARVFQDQPVPPAQLRSDIPPELDLLVRRCLAKDPAERVGDVAELGRSLVPFGGPGAPLAAARVAQLLGAPPAATETLPVPAQTAGGSPQAAGSSLQTASSPQTTGASWQQEARPGARGSRVPLVLSLVVVALVAAAGGVAAAIHFGLAPAGPAGPPRPEDSAAAAQNDGQTTLPPGPPGRAAPLAASASGEPGPSALPGPTTTATPPPSASAAVLASASASPPRPPPQPGPRPPRPAPTKPPDPFGGGIK